MRKMFFAFSGIILFLSGCSGVEGYRFTCKVDTTLLETSEIPNATITNTTITINAYSGNTRFQLTTPYGEQQYTTGAGNNALIQYWPNENFVSDFYSSDADPNGYILIDRITSMGVAGAFSATLYKTGEENIVLQNGDFFAKRP